MAVLHRALFTWFNFLIFLILLVLRLDQRIQWNWFIVFMPMWIHDNILMIYIIFHMISHCKNGPNRIILTLRIKPWYIVIAVLLKMSAQILICLKLEVPQWQISAKAVLAPYLVLFSALAVDVFFDLIISSRLTL